MVNGSMGMKKEFDKDIVHPNKKGYLIMEEILLKTLKKNSSNLKIIFMVYFLINITIFHLISQKYFVRTIKI